MRKILLAGVAAFTSLFMLSSSAPASAVTTDPMLNTTYSNQLGSLANWDALGRRAVSTDSAFLSTDVWIYGDSITRSDWVDLRARLGRVGHTAAVDAQAGIPTTPQVARLKERVAKHRLSPRVLVMALGTNDIYNPAYVRDAIRQTRAAVGPITRIVWVDVYAARPTWTAVQRTLGKQSVATVNAAIAAGTSAGDINFRVRWYSAVTRYSWLKSAYLTDGIHTTERGRSARNALIVTGVRRFLG